MDLFIRPVCSGDMYPSVPSSLFGWIVEDRSKFKRLDNSKSIRRSSFVTGLKMMFDGLMSLWVYPLLWTPSRASIIFNESSKKSNIEKGDDLRSEARDRPSMSSCTITGLLLCSIFSKTSVTPFLLMELIVLYSFERLAISSGLGWILLIVFRMTFLLSANLIAL